MAENVANDAGGTPKDAKCAAERLPWGRLVSLTPERCPTVDLVDDRVKVGRDRLLNPTREISSTHFQVWREQGPEGVLVFIRDESTNGTFLNRERLTRGQQKIIETGCDISMLDPARRTDSLNFTFLDLDAERAEAENGGPQSAYDFKQVLGTGQFATVRLAVEKSSGKTWAMKVIDRRHCSGSKRRDVIMDEVRILKQINHPNVISVHEVYETPKRLYLVLELVTGGELFDAIVEGKMSEERARDVAKQMFGAIQYLHSMGISHRDLKPENILLAEKGSNSIKISDFGLSRVIDEGKFMSTMCGTPQYVAPEVLTGEYSPAVDQWSAGVIIYAMLSGTQPFDDSKGTNDLFEKIKKGAFSFPEAYWKTISLEAQDLIKKLLVVDPKKRLSPTEALGHAWLTTWTPQPAKDEAPDKGEDKAAEAQKESGKTEETKDAAKEAKQQGDPQTKDETAATPKRSNKRKAPGSPETPTRRVLPRSAKKPKKN